MYLTYSPFWLQWLYPTLTWHKGRKEKYVYLTFDDGPTPVVTPFVLNILNNFGAKATFFCIGDNVKKFPEIYADVLANGHRVGNHTFDHLRGWDCSDEKYLSSVKKCSELVNSNLFRPPYGRIKKSQISSIRSHLPNLHITMWDVLSGDFDPAVNGEKCLQNVLRHTRNGSIIVFHDSLKASGNLYESLPAVLSELTSRGFAFKTL
ncbi:MAG: polysaccharide deacetylase family protein [Daejeonella sp.]